MATVGFEESGHPSNYCGAVCTCVQMHPVNWLWINLPLSHCLFSLSLSHPSNYCGFGDEKVKVKEEIRSEKVKVTLVQMYPVNCKCKRESKPRVNWLWINISLSHCLFSLSHPSNYCGLGDEKVKEEIRSEKVKVTLVQVHPVNCKCKRESKPSQMVVD